MHAPSMRRGTLWPGALLLIGLLVGCPAYAQYNPLIPSQAYLGMARAATLHNIGRHALRQATGPAPTARPAPPAGTDMTLTFDPSIPVRTDIRERLLDGLAAGNAATKATLERAFAGDAILVEFERLLKSYGYSSRNVADVMTAYLVIAWEIVSDADASRNIAGIRAVNLRLRRALLGNATILTLPNDQKERIAELMAYQTVLAVGARRRLSQANDQDGLHRLRAQVRDAAIQWGTDPLGLRLTGDGFVR